MAAAVVILLVLAGLSGFPSARASGYPVLATADEGRFLTNLSAPVLGPGGSGPIGFEVRDPLAAALSDAVLTIQPYGFNAFPGNATGPVPGGSVLTFSGGSPNGSGISVAIGPLGPGARFEAPGNVSIRVAAASSAPSGTYALRTSLSFRSGGTVYLLESRGFFSAAQWAGATLVHNGTAEQPTLNLTCLGVSGITAETAVLVQTNSVAPWLYGILAASLVLAAVGAFVAWRRGPSSRSGARAPPPPQKARTAFGRSRRSDGD
jgi:hypothetical protein